jgi:nicotinate-nucleotide adenylyltransferase
MATIAIYGGSFNPPHVAHQMVCLFVLETEALDGLWLLPTFRHPFDKQLAPFDDRVAMCERMAAPFGGRVAVSRIEEEMAGRPGFVSSRTAETLQALVDAHPGDRFRLVVGADVLAEIDKWYRWDEVVRLAPPLVIGRSGFAHPAAGPDGTRSLGLEMPEVSSSEVRARLARGESAHPLVPRSVMEYIGRRGLYR